MVELRLDAQEGSFTKDMYVAVRVGDVQKLSKVGTSKSYKFPANAAKGRRYGKVELFRRVGSSSISIDQENVTNVQQVTMQDKENPFSFQVHLANGVAIEKQVEAKDDSNPKVAAAKAYLDKHHLELRLAEAMQSVLRERPDDPAAYVAAKLLANAGMVSISPKAAPPPSQPKVEVVMLPFKAYYSKYVASLPAPAWDAMYAKFPAKAKAAQVSPPIVPCIVEAKPVPKSIAPPAGTPRQAVLSSSFGDYHKKHMKSCPGKAFAVMYAAFPSKVAWRAPGAPVPGSFTEYYRNHIAECPVQAWETMHAGFKSKKPAKAAVEASGAGWQQLASVGTWCAPLLIRHVPADVEEQKPEQNFQQLASVGTWCAPRLFREDPAESESLVVPSSNFVMRPSVGTWLAPLLEQATGDAVVVEFPASPSHLSPSVGTWLIHVSPSDEPPAIKKKPLHVLPMSTRFGAAFASCGVRPGMVCF